MAGIYAGVQLDADPRSGVILNYASPVMGGLKFRVIQDYRVRYTV